MTKAEKAALSKEIMRHRHLYSNDMPEISDYEFDRLLDTLAAEDPEDPAVVAVGAEPTGEWPKKKHRIAMGSLNKLNTPDEMQDWIGKNLNADDRLFICEKLDGLSICLNYDNGKLVEAILRGGGEGEGEDILPNVLKMNGVKKTLSFSGSLRGEVMLHREEHEEHFPEYKNPRNAASGISRRSDGEGCEHLTVYFYQAVSDETTFTSDREQFEFLSKKLGLYTPAHYEVFGSGKQKFEFVLGKWNEYQKTVRDDLNYEIDGLVCGISDLEAQSSLGEIHSRPKGKVAWKFENQLVESTITGITWTAKKASRLSPIVHIEPVSVLGSTVSNATVYNYAYIEKLGLGVGAKVLLCKANEIIPRIERVIEPATEVFSAPTKCPMCGSKVLQQDVYLICTSDSCTGKVRGILNSWIKNLGVMEWGKGLIDKLVDSELVGDIGDLYSLTVDDLLTLERMGETSAAKAIKELWKVDTVSLSDFIGSLGILNVGRTTIDLLADNGFDTLAKLFDARADDFLSVKGIGATKAVSLYDGLRKNAGLINKITENGVKITKIEKAVPVVGGKLSGMKICITGKTNMKRDALAQLISKHGGVFEKSVKPGTTHLVIVSTDSATVKAKSARENGTALIDENTLMNMMGE